LATDTVACPDIKHSAGRFRGMFYYIALDGIEIDLPLLGQRAIMLR
jgi:hypothetical protein